MFAIRRPVWISLIAACAATMSFASHAQHAQEPVIDLVGTWSWSMPNGQCTETHTYRQDGSRSVVSGAENSDSRYAVEAVPNSRFRKLTITTTKDYRGVDCGGADEDDTGRTSSVYYVLKPDGSQVLFCYQPEFKQCYGPFSRVSGI